MFEFHIPDSITQLIMTKLQNKTKQRNQSITINNETPKQTSMHNHSAQRRRR
jgi:hypothetical protein